MRDRFEKAAVENEGALLLEVLACTGLKIGETPIVTVESVRAGTIAFYGASGSRQSDLPECLQEKLLWYAEQRGICEGRIFDIQLMKPAKNDHDEGLLFRSDSND